ncbi:hypothetical protein [Streptomyces chilikensis]|uniref:Uncharacterized protein n=1 Tax=Streptomyces chilikensis TaxID=1194079 RepID=A0ABV3ERR9_9ACTN
MADLTYKQLVAATAALSKEVRRGAEAIKVRAQRIEEEARDTEQVAEMIGALNVDADTVAETRQAARITRSLSEAAITYASAADTTATSFDAATAQAHTTHAGINEAVNASGVAGIHDVNRTWFTQE